MSIQDRIKHVFVLMLENRSYDHVFGFSDVGDFAGNEANVWNGQSFKPLAGADFAMPNDPAHGFIDVLQQLSGATATYPPNGPFPKIDMSGFAANFAGQLPPAHTASIFKGFTPQQLPVLNFLAREFCVCRRWFSSMPGPTWPNRFFVHAASSGGMDDMPTRGELTESFLATGYSFEQGTIFQRLTKANRRWTVWESDETPQTTLLAGMIEDNWESELGTRPLLRDFADFAQAIQAPEFDIAYNFIEPAYGTFFGTNPRGGNSMHPVEDVTRGEALIKQVYDAIRRSPHWNESLLIVVFDEHGGFYDHVPPPAAEPPGDRALDTDNSRHGFDFRQLGVRVPSLIVSPWVRKGQVDETQRDHTSILRTIEDIFELNPLTARDRAAASLVSLMSDTPLRDDAPLVASNPAHSGLIQSGWLQQIIDRFGSFLGGLPGARELTPMAEAFIHVAARRQLQMAPSAAAVITDRVQSIQSQAEAARYVQSVRQAYRHSKPAQLK
jgi:phospholipase C